LEKKESDLKFKKLSYSSIIFFFRRYSSLENSNSVIYISFLGKKKVFVGIYYLIILFPRHKFYLTLVLCYRDETII